MPLPVVLVIVTFACLIFMGAVLLYAQCIKIAPPGFALIRTGMAGSNVSFTRLLAYPVLHKVECMDIRYKHFTLICENNEGATCADDMQVNLHFSFMMRVNHSEDDIVKVAQSIGCQQVGQTATLRQLFEAKFLEAIKTTTRQFSYESLLKERDAYKAEVLQAIGGDLSGFILNNASITHIGLTPRQYLDPDILSGAKALKALTERLAQVHKDVSELPLTQTATNAKEQQFLLAFQQGESAAIHQAHIRFLREQGALDVRLVSLKVKLEAEVSPDIRTRLQKQIEDLKRKRQDLKTQFEVEKKSIKVRYQRKLLAAKRSNELPPEP
ncbi:SPFH domain-containing protein [Microscilla marina]|uniref:Putative secreted protein n=1 Tax=Microscilla marina ATCC 23134 TaxID=313606 RepID=A1ZRK3_MICM2|nr:SPFH domain-containing protein [Microscilla marina]EAY26908.1 putative secreted protein [Microscilla marina ATCC 23134]